MKTQFMEQSEHKLLSEFIPTPSTVYYVYILKNCKDNGLYYGYTNNLERRIAEHKNKMLGVGFNSQTLRS